MTKRTKKEASSVTKRGTIKPPYLKRHTDFVCRFCSSSSKPSSRRNQLEKAKKSQVYAVCECIRNVITCKCPVDDSTRAKLQRFKKPLLKLSLPKRSLTIEQRKQLLNQKGSGIFLPLILSSVASYLIDRVRKS